MGRAISKQERFRREYARRRPGWRDCLTIYRHLVSQTVDPGDRVLDLGCGHAGWLMQELAPAGLLVGGDPDLEALKRNTSHRNRLACDAEHLPFERGSLDLVVAAFVFEHLANPVQAASELARVVRPGGRLVFLTPNAWNYQVWLIRAVPNRVHERMTRRLYGRMENDTYPVRYRLNSPRRLERVLSAAGFQRLALVMNGDPTYAGLNRPLFALASGLERLMDVGPLRATRVHLVGAYERRSDSKD